MTRSTPVRELSRSRKKKGPRAVELTEGTVAALRVHLRVSPEAAKYDLVDLVDVLSGRGCRIGELLALDWTKVDADTGTLSIEGTVIRIPGEGLIVQPHTKSKAGMRRITPPTWVLDLLKRRHLESLGAWIFPTTGPGCATRTTPGPGCATWSGRRRGKACTRMRSGTWWRLSLTEQTCQRAKSPTIWATSASR
jgi:hypothetical protein